MKHMHPWLISPLKTLQQDQHYGIVELSNLLEQIVSGIARFINKFSVEHGARSKNITSHYVQSISSSLHARYLL